MSKEWARAQQAAYSATGSRRTGSAWAAKLLPKLVRVGRRQWLHRNHQKHNESRTRHAEYEKLLNRAIIQEFTKGTATLQQSDRSQLNHSVIHLLSKSLRVRQSWWSNIQIARQRYHRHQLHLQNWKDESRATSLLWAWLQTGRAQ